MAVTTDTPIIHSTISRARRTLLSSFQVTVGTTVGCTICYLLLKHRAATKDRITAISTKSRTYV